MPRTSDTLSLPVSKMADVFELPKSKMAANRMTTKYNDEAKNTLVTALRPRYVTQQQQQLRGRQRTVFFSKTVTACCWDNS